MYHLLKGVECIFICQSITSQEYDLFPHNRTVIKKISSDKEPNIPNELHNLTKQIEPMRIAKLYPRPRMFENLSFQ